MGAGRLWLTASVIRGAMFAGGELSRGFTPTRGSVAIAGVHLDGPASNS